MRRSHPNGAQHRKIGTDTFRQFQLDLIMARSGHPELVIQWA